MKLRLVTIPLGLSLLLSPALLWGQATGSATAPLKFGVISFQEAISQTGEGKKAIADLQKKYQPRQQELQKLQQDIQAISDQLQKQATTLSDDENRRLNRELEDKQKLLKRSSEDFNADAGADRDDVFRRLSQKMVGLIREYGAQNGYGVIMDISQVPVAYVAQEVDITDEMVKRYDKANPVEAPAAAATPAAPATKPPATAAKTPAPKPADKPKP